MALDTRIVVQCIALFASRTFTIVVVSCALILCQATLVALLGIVFRTLLTDAPRCKLRTPVHVTTLIQTTAVR